MTIFTQCEETEKTCNQILASSAQGLFMSLTMASTGGALNQTRMRSDQTQTKLSLWAHYRF